jgi:hypothetical protein
MATRTPAHLRCDPLVIVTAVTGPGIITPEAERKMTEPRNRGRLSVLAVINALLAQ